MFRGSDSRLYEKVWTRDGWKPVELGREYAHHCVSCDAVISNGNRARSSINGVPQTCEKCERHNELKRASARVVLKLNRHIQARKDIPKEAKPIRNIHRDTARRYIQRFDGSTFAVPTAEDDADIYLRNAFGLTIAKVLPTDKYPPQSEQVFDLPF